MALELKLSNVKTWQISPYLAESLSLESGQSIWLLVGAEKRKVEVAVHEDYSCTRLHRQWANELKLTPGKWKVRRVTNGVRLGPVIGLVCKKLPSRPPGKSVWARYLNSIGSGLGIILTPDGFDKTQRTIRGLTLSQDRMRWVKREMPWPDAIYVRLYPVKNTFKKFLQQEFEYCHFNTQTLLNKWLVYQLLSSQPDIISYLPATAILDDNPETLHNWVEKYTAVYVKPVIGNKGLGIMRIAAKHGEYQIDFRQGQQNKQLVRPLTDSISKECAAIMGSGKYIIQQAIVIPKYGNRTRDFRVLIQKKEDGQWHVTGLAGRLGSAGSIVNNVDSGGERIHLASILESGTVPKYQRIREIQQISMRIAVFLEKYYGQLGEMGLDFCIDCEERLWLLEVNGMPDKSLFSEFFSPDVANNVYRAPMLYAAYLSGFSDVIYPLAP